MNLLVEFSLLSFQALSPVNYTIWLRLQKFVLEKLRRITLALHIVLIFWQTFRYIALITKEHKLLKEEIRLTDKFNLYEREERELFTTLTSSVKDSHEKERIQANKTKYLSIIGSVVGALIGIIGSTINNRSKMSELRKMVMFI